MNEEEYYLRATKSQFMRKRNKAAREYLVENIVAISRFEVPGATKLVNDEHKRLKKKLYHKKWYNIFFVKLYFEWKYILLGKPFTKKDFLERPDEDEFIEILYVLYRKAGISIRELDCPFSLVDMFKKYEEVTNDGESELNCRENCARRDHEPPGLVS